MKKEYYLILILFFAGFCTGIVAQPYADGMWKYEAHPDLPFQLKQVDLELSVVPEAPSIKASAVYTIRSRRPGLTSVVFNTSDLDIRGITFGQEPAEFRITNDSLIIELPDTLHFGSETEMKIDWESSSPYGINKDVYGNIWTSLNPQMQNHWIPIPDHPEVESKVRAVITIPADKEVVFTGERTSDEITSTNERKVSWSSETPVPLTGISLAIGNFDHETARSGVKEVSLWTPENGLIDEVRSGLLEVAVESIKTYEQQLEFEFPFENLRVVVLPDHDWEEIQTGAGVVYLYQNLGSLRTQLQRGIAAQWFGNYHRYLTPIDRRYEFMKALVSGSSQNRKLAENTGLRSIDHWNSLQGTHALKEENFQKRIIEGSLPELLQQYKGVTGWEDYSDFWYDEVGKFWYDIAIGAEQGASPDDTPVTYRVEYLYDEMDSRLSLAFEAVGNPVTSLVDIRTTEYGFSDTTRSELSFTGDRDTVNVDISSGTEYVTLNVISDQNIILQEEKPFMFLIRQLRNTSPDVQIQAAEQLRSFTDNPDVQLAIQDILRDEENVEVRAALLETLATLTKGATGTEETFLAGLNSDNQAIRLSSIRSLVNYPENERVRNALRNTMLRSEQDTVFKTALRSYQQLSTAEDIRGITERLAQNDQHHRAISALEIAIAKDSTRESISIADRYALGNYPYEIRTQALDLLIQYEENEAYWEQTMAMLLEDRDARIRFQALNAIQHLSSKTTVELMRERLNEEMDPRVRAKIRRIL